MNKKTLQIIYWIITILFFGFLMIGAIFEFMQAESAKKLLTDLGYPIYVNYILSIAKIIGGILIFQWKWKTIKEWAYAGFTIDIVAAAASMYFAGVGVGSAIFTLVFLIPLFVSYCLMKKIENM